MSDISALLEAAEPREIPVQVCLDGTAAGRLAELHEQAGQFADWQPGSLGEVNPAAALVAQLAEARATVAAAIVEFRLRALGHRAFSGLLAQHPPRPGTQLAYDPDTFLPALLAACCTAPELSPGQVELLLDRVNHGTAQALFDAALAVNEEPSPIPF